MASAELAKTHANDFRLIVNDPVYQSVFPDMRIKRDTDREITKWIRWLAPGCCECVNSCSKRDRVDQKHQAEILR
jgi:hypothetical protein